MTYRDIAALVLLALVVGAGVLGIRRVVTWYEASKTAEVQGRTMQATSDINADGAAADEQRAATDTGLAQSRQAFLDTYQQDKRHDPAIASRADRTVPERVRNNFRAQRLARERLGCTGEQCSARPADDAAE